MISAYEEGQYIPSQSIYDTATMQMAISAAKDMYDRGQKQLEEFYERYGDFMSPFSKDMDRYGQLVGGVRDLINNAYARGVDLLQSPEGRMLIQQATHMIDPREFNIMRANAKLGYEYLKEIENAKNRGEFDQDYENWRLQQEGGPGLFSDFSSAKGMWNMQGPGRYQDPNKMVSPLFDHMQDEFIESDGQYDYSGVSRNRRQQVLSANLGALLSTDNGRYHYELSRARAAQLLGRTPTEQEVITQYQNDLLDASNRFEHRTRTENKDWARRRESQLRMSEDTHRTNNDIRAAKERIDYEHKIDYDYETLKLMDENRDYKVSDEERKKYTGVAAKEKDKNKENVFYRTDLNNGYTTIYDPAKGIDEKITPIAPEIYYEPAAKKEDSSFYRVPNNYISSALFRIQGGKLVPLTAGETKEIKTHWFTSDEVVDDGGTDFIATGNMKYVDGSYVISGYVEAGEDGNERIDCVMKVNKRK